MKKPNLFKTITSYTIILFCTFALLFIGGNYLLSYKSYKNDIKNIQIQHTKEVKETLKWEVEHFIELLKYKREKFENEQKHLLRSRVFQAHRMMQRIYDKYKDVYSSEQIQDIIITTLRKIRFEDEGYFYIINTKGDVFLFDVRKDFEGKNILHIQNSDGMKITQEMIALAKKSKEGFLTYKWLKPLDEIKEVEKTSYLKFFKPFNWIIGTGIYQDDLEDNIRKALLKNVEQLKFTTKNNNYIFIGQWNGISLTYPAIGKDMYNIQDKNGLYVVQELIEKAKEGGGFVEYMMPSLEDERNTLKMSYVQGFPLWQWYIGAGLYVDDINDEIALVMEKVYHELIISTIITVILSLFILILFLYTYSRINKRMLKDFEAFKNFFNSLVYNSTKIDIASIKFSEFEEMAIHANKMLEEKLNLEEDLVKYKKIVSTSDDFLALVDKNYVYQAVNETYLRYFGKTREEIINHHVKEILSEELFVSKIKPLLDRVLKGETFSVELWVDFPQGKRFLESKYFPYYKDNVIEYFVLASRDNTEKKLAQEKVKLWKKVFDNTSEAVMICDINAVIVDVNNAFTTITGYSLEEVKGEKSSIINYEAIGIGDLSGVCGRVKKLGTWSGEVKNRRKNGTLYPALFSANALLDENGEITNFIAVFSDITILKESEKRLQFLAHHDSLTNLPNKILLTDRITHAIANAKRNESMLAICFIDLDNFKKVNDSFGHTYGDDVLKQCAIRIKQDLREVDTLSRIGGDEFILLLENLNDVLEVETIVNKIHKEFEKEFISNSQQFLLSASIGISLYPQHGHNADELIKNADIAMYKSKEAGKSTYRFFTDEMSVATHALLDMENDLREAIKEEQFITFYQPQMNLKTKEVIGLEALVRWKHPIKGLLTPLQFIQCSEENKMIIAIGEFVLRKSCEDLLILQKELGFEGRISINVSAVQIENSDFLGLLKQVIEEMKVDPNKLELEITESVIMEDPQRWIELLNCIKKLGIQIAIDDFGTGYSSLNYLRKLPIDKLKIDMSFVSDIPHEEDACAIANSIINLSKNMKMITLAEGIEKEEQEKYLQEYGCEEGQGYLYSKPLPIDKIKQWLRDK